MSTEKQMNSYPQHRIIFADRESLTPNENDRYIKQFWMDVYKENSNEGAVRSDGTIAWDCPCLGTQAIGPCSAQFRKAFSCYQNSCQEPKGSECMLEFRQMQNCFSKYPKLYNKHSHQDSENELDLKSNPMTHPEARRHRLNEGKKISNN